jgi:signal transduction histidine kinase
VANLAVAYEELSAIILQMTGASLVFILRWDNLGEKSEIVNCSLHGGNTDGINHLKASFQKDSPLRPVIEPGKIVTWSEDQVNTLPEPLREFLKETDIRLLILAPIIIHQLGVGVLGVAMAESSTDSILQQFDLVERMALDLANLAQDAIVLDQALTLATVKERNRLARDLHDSVTQVLFSASLLAEVLPKIWERDPEQGIQKVNKLRNLTRGALAEMRTMLLELRPSAVVNTPLSDLLTQLTEAVSSRSGLKFQLSIEQIPLLPHNVQDSFYRIAQESLNNIVKHAQAGLVTINLSVSPPSSEPASGEEHEVKLVIQDDGVGYSSENGHPSRLGLEIMRERAAAVQASLLQESQPGYGTRVTLIWRGETGSVK